WSLNITTTTAIAPSKPVISAANVVSQSQINVFWNQNPAGENVTSYNLRINGSDVITGITFLSYPVKNLTQNTTYTFEVQAVNSFGASTWSAPINATTLSVNPPPNAPNGITTSVVSSSQINVFWNASSSQNVTSYNLRINGTDVISNITYLSYPVKN